MALIMGMNSGSSFDGIDVANNIPACSGAERFTILGKIAPSPRLARGIPA